MHKQNMTAYTKDDYFAGYAIGHKDYLGIVTEKLDIVAGSLVVWVGVTTYKAVKRSNTRPGN